MVFSTIECDGDGESVEKYRLAAHTDRKARTVGAVVTTPVTLHSPRPRLWITINNLTFRRERGEQDCDSDYYSIVQKRGAV